MDIETIPYIWAGIVIIILIIYTWVNILELRKNTKNIKKMKNINEKEITKENP